MDGERQHSLAHLSSVLQHLAQARDLGAVLDVVGHESRSLTGADGATIVLREGDDCYYAEEDAIAPLWKGQRFPMGSCISGWAMTHRAAAVVPDIERDPRIPLAAYRPTFVRSLAVVPIGTADPVGAIGHYWADCDQPTGDRVTMLQTVADVTSVALEILHARSDLRELARQKAAQLAEAQDRLAAEHRLRRDAEEQARRLLHGDPLTGLCNRRGFIELAQQALDQARRAGRAAWVITADVDGLRLINERSGLRDGDRVLGAIAAALRLTFARSDVIGRTGDDEFSVFGTGGLGRADGLLDQLHEAIARSLPQHAGTLSLSIGCARCASDDFAGLDVYLRAASHALSVEKLARRLARRR